jgi:TIR domain-containing protein
MAIMLSYSRKDEAVVKALARDLEAAKRQVWFDHNLVGGDAWWDSILRNIRSATVFLFALSDASLHSKPCRLELDYAFDLGRPIVPVRVGPVHSLRASPLAALQIVDYSLDNARSGFAVLAAVDDAAARERPLPDPLPPAPPIPFGYLLAIGRQIDSAELSLTEQLAAVDQLRRALGEETEESVQRDIVSMLKNLSSKPWTAKRIEREVAALLYAYGPGAVPEAGGEGAGPAAVEPASVGPVEPAPAGGEGGESAGLPADEPAPAGSVPAEPVPAGPAPVEPAPAGSAPGGSAPADPSSASRAGTPEPTSSGTPEADPRAWFAQRLEQLERRRAAEEGAYGAGAQPWRLPPGAVDQWSRTLGPAPYPWPAVNAPSPGAPGSPPPAAAPPPPGGSAAVPQQAPPSGFVLFVLKVWEVVCLAARGFVLFLIKVWGVIRLAVSNSVQFVLLKMRS